jgi:hypothetical protein
VWAVNASKYRAARDSRTRGSELIEGRDVRADFEHRREELTEVIEVDG